VGDRVLVAHNSDFDTGFIRAECQRQGYEYNYTAADTLILSQNLLSHLNKFKLNIVANALSLPDFNHHRAADDAMTCGLIMAHLMKKLEEERDKILANAKGRISKRTTGSGKFQVTQWGAYEYQRQLNAEEQKVALEEFMASDENYKKVNERYEKMKEQYDSSNRSLKEYLRKIQEGEDRIEDGKREVENVRAEHDIDVWRDEEEAMYQYYEALSRLEEENARKAQEDAEKKARLDKELHEQRMKNAEDELRQLNTMQSEAENRLSAAQSQVS
jgi:DNA polymerase III epsilon subunit-like protein